MRIFALNPPFLPRFSREQRSPAVTKSGTLYYPMWLAYAVGVLERDGHKVKLFDAPALGVDLKITLNECRTFDPQLILISTSTPSIVYDLKTCSEIKKNLPFTKIALVGPHITATPFQTLAMAPYVDFLARGEFEITIAELAEFLEGLEKTDDVISEQIFKIAGLSFRWDGEIIHNPDRSPIKDLDSLPFVSSVYKRHLDIKNYFYSICQHPEIAIVTGRGCKHKCIFCVYPQTIHKGGYRVRSVENVIEEFLYIQLEFPEVKEIFIEDDTITVERGRCLAICEELIKRGSKISWTANSRCDVDFELLKAMKEAGCRLLCVGVESGNQKILDNIRKDLTLDQIRKFFQEAKRAGLMVHACFMAGNPGENLDTLKQTLDFALELSPDTAQFFPLMVYPGTEAYHWAKENGYLETEDYSKWLTPEGLHNCVVSTKELTAKQLVDFCNYARRVFYTRPKYLLKKAVQVLVHPEEFKRNFRSALNLSKYLFKK